MGRDLERRRASSFMNNTSNAACEAAFGSDSPGVDAEQVFDGMLKRERERAAMSFAGEGRKRDRWRADTFPSTWRPDELSYRSSNIFCLEFRKKKERKKKIKFFFLLLFG